MSIQRYQMEDVPRLDKMSYRLLYISTSRYEGDWHSTPHAHHCTELFYVIRGKGSFLVNDNVFDVCEDDMIIVNPNVVHTEMSRGDSPLEYIVLGIEGLQFTSFSEQEDEEEEEKDNNFEVVCQNLLEVLIINMVRRTKANLLIAPAKKVAKECRFVEQYINNHFREEISLELLSEKAFMNKFYLVHAFKQYKGISPINYLIQLRIKEAKELLSTTNYSISQISESSGFSSQSYFSQVFKKETGMTPNEYRKTVH